MRLDETLTVAAGCAFHVDGSHQIHKVSVRVRHHFVDEGFSIPELDDYFRDVVNLVHTWVYRGFVVFHHERFVPKRQSEFMICRRGVNCRALVNLRAKDRRLVRPMIKAYAHVSLTRTCHIHAGGAGFGPTAP